MPQVNLHHFPSFEAAETALLEARTVDRTVLPDAPISPVNDLDVIVTDDDGRIFIVYAGRTLPYTDPRFSGINGFAIGSTASLEVARRYREDRARQLAALKAKEKTNAIRAAIQEAVGPRLQYRDGSTFLDGHLYYGLEIREERTAISSWTSRPNGKHRVVVGGYGDKRQFPERKDGSFNYAEIARRVIAEGDRAAALRQAEAQRTAAAPCVEAARAELKFVGKHEIGPAPDEVRPIALKVVISRQLTLSQLLKLDALLTTWDAETRSETPE